MFSFRNLSIPSYSSVYSENRLQNRLLVFRHQTILLVYSVFVSTIFKKKKLYSINRRRDKLKVAFRGLVLLCHYIIIVCLCFYC